MNIFDRRVLFGFFLLVFFTTACNAPFERFSQQAAETPTRALPPAPSPERPTLVPSPSPTATEVPPPTPTATLVPSPTPADPFVSPLDKDVVCRFGPGIVYVQDGGLLVGEMVPVVGRDEFSTWWRIENPRREGKYCWVSALETKVEGDPMLAPVSPPPTNIVTSVVVAMKPGTISLSPCVFPTTFDVSFSIEVTGPTTVKLERFLSDGDTAPVETVTFTQGGAKEFSDYYKVGEVGEHWFGVRVISPNAITAKATGKVVCP